MTLPNRDRQELIRRTLRLCALEVDPQGQLKRLAERMFVSPKVFSYWVNKGRVPKRKAELLHSLFPAIVTDPSDLHG